MLVNKWVLAKYNNLRLGDYVKQLQTKFSFMPWAPIIFLSAKTSLHVADLYTLINQVYQAASRRIATGLLNDVIGEAQAMMQAPSYKGRHLKIQYATQVSVLPPKFVFFVNDRNLLHFSYERYLENQIRQHFDFAGTPIYFLLREKRKQDG